MLNTAEQIVSFGQGNLHAVAQSGEALASGCQDIARQVVTTAQASLEEGLAHFRAVTQAKSLQEALELQNRAARAWVERVVSDSGKLTEHSIRVAGQAYAPLSARFEAAIEAFAVR